MWGAPGNSRGEQLLAGKGEAAGAWPTALLNPTHSSIPLPVPEPPGPTAAHKPPTRLPLPWPTLQMGQGSVNSELPAHTRWDY